MAAAAGPAHTATGSASLCHDPPAQRGGGSAPKVRGGRGGCSAHVAIGFWPRCIIPRRRGVALAGSGRAVAAAANPTPPPPWQRGQRRCFATRSPLHGGGRWQRRTVAGAAPPPPPH